MQEEEQVFTFYVVGVMATGKSTLINAMLGRKMMPYNHTSYSLICVEHANNDGYQGVAYDVNKHEIMKDDNLTRHTLQEWNDDERISFINVKGNIPFVSSLGVRVRIVEVPTWNKKDYFEFLQSINCERSFVIFIARADCFLSDYERELIQCICDMTKYDVQFHDRCIFAINKMDVINPEEESVEYALAKMKSNLENKGMFNPRLFPVSAQVALEARTRPIIELVLPIYRQYVRCFPSTRYDSYYNYTHLPDYIRMEIEYELIMAKNNQNKKEGEYAAIEIHSGMVSLEKAIALHLNKYINK